MRFVAVPLVAMVTGAVGRYVPARIAIVWPGRTSSTALVRLASGAFRVPRLSSRPFGATYRSARVTPVTGADAFFAAGRAGAAMAAGLRSGPAVALGGGAAE